MYTYIYIYIIYVPIYTYTYTYIYTYLYIYIYIYIAIQPRDLTMAHMEWPVNFGDDVRHHGMEWGTLKSDKAKGK